MTATYPARTGRAYRGVVYGIDLLDHASLMAGNPQIVPDDYIGQTRQKGRARENQHRDSQPFSDLIVGSPHVLWEGVCTDEELDAIERRFILERAPRMNWVHNEGNPRQIPKWVQKEQRHQRDDRAGRLRWEPPGQRTRESLLEWDTQDRPAHERDSPVRQKRSATVKRKPWSPVKKRIVGWGSAWLVSTLVLWLLALVRWHLGGWQQTLAGSAATLPVAVSAFCLIVANTAKARTRRKIWRAMFGGRR